MIKIIKYLFSFIIFTLFISCSFDNKTGIWSGSEDEIKKISELKKDQEKKKEVIKVYSSNEIFAKEIPATSNVNLTQAKENLSWEMSGLNLQNFIGNNYLSGISNKFLKKKIGKNKFSISTAMTSPLTSNENIIFADDTGTIYNINQNGKINWKKNIYKKIYKQIYKSLVFSINEDKIYVADNIGFIYAVNLNNGNIEWVKNHGIPIKSNLKIFNNKIFLINQDNRILCFDVRDGSLIWDARSASSFIKSQNLLSLAISKRGELITLNSSGDLSKHGANNGKMYWTLNSLGFGFTHDADFFKSSQVVISDEDIIFSASSSTFSINIKNGYLNWKLDIASKGTPIIDGNNIFIVSDNGFFINIEKNSGKIIWSTNILKILKKKNQKTKVTGFVLGSDKIYSITLNGYLIISSAESGQVEYFVKIGHTLTTSPIISNGSIYILTENSRIFGFN